MKIIDYFPWIYKAVMAQQRRTLLTVFGFSTGIAAVILLNSIGESLRQFIMQEFTQFGTHIVAITPGKTETYGMSGVLNTIRPLSLADAQSLTRLPAAEKVVPVVMGTARVKQGKRARYTDVAGVTSPAINAWNLAIAKGKFLPDDDIQRPRALAVLGSLVKEELFGAKSAIGHKIHIGGQSFRVIGILEPKGEFMGVDLDDMVYIPAAKGLQLFNRDSLMEIDIFYRADASTEAFKKQVKNHLIQRHNREDFTIITQDDMLQTLDKILRFVKYAAAGLGMISLLVGAVGIVTILTITVSERTREIGLLRALGFSSARIRLLFLGEAILLAVNSGIIGYLLAMTLLFIVKILMPGVPVGFDPYVLVLALTISTLTGVLAGWRPAKKASALEPVIALRAE